MLTLIAATSTNNALGKDNQLVWHLPDDFKRFKALTSEHYIIMGRKTFESFPKPLPNRTHVIITRQSDYKAPEGCIVVSSLEEAIEVCPKNEDVFIIGNNKAKIKLVSFTEKPKTRVFGQHRNMVMMSEDFNDSLSDDFWLGNESIVPELCVTAHSSCFL